MIKKYTKGIERRKIRIRKKIIGTTIRPRITVYRSSKSLYAQLIDDGKKKTLLGISEKEIKIPAGKKLTKSERAKLLGVLFGEKLHKRKITSVVFDKGGYKYHGRIKIFADEVRSSGIKL